MTQRDESKSVREIIDEEVDLAVERERRAAARLVLIALAGGYAFGLVAGWAMGGG